jgi:hypothetical protein
MKGSLDFLPELLHHSGSLRVKPVAGFSICTPVNLSHFQLAMVLPEPYLFHNGE